MIRSAEPSPGREPAVPSPGSDSTASLTGRDPVVSPAQGRLRPMTPADVPAVHAIETAAYEFPWTSGNFADSLAAGYPALVLEDPSAGLAGYLVALRGVDEMHLLNITVAPPAQGRGHARTLFDALLGLCRAHRAGQLWLEVRTSNARAQALYRHLGFLPIGRRKGYYPAAAGRREDAIVMSLALVPEEGGDALG